MLKSVQRCTPNSRILLERRFLSTNPLLPYSFQRALIPIANIANEANTSIPLTKIVATIGPASEQLPMLTKVAEAGLTVMRINFSHATYEEADLRTTNLNSFREKDITTAASPKDGWVVNTRAIMLDTQGPEIRTGSFEGVKEVELKAGNEVTSFEKRSVHPRSSFYFANRLLSLRILPLEQSKPQKSFGFPILNYLKLRNLQTSFYWMMEQFNYKL